MKRRPPIDWAMTAWFLAIAVAVIAVWAFALHGFFCWSHGR